MVGVQNPTPSNGGGGLQNPTTIDEGGYKMHFSGILQGIKKNPL